MSGRVDECRQITVTRLKFTRGGGTERSVLRQVTAYYLNGVLLVEQDPCPEHAEPNDHDCAKHRVGGACAVCTVLNQRDTLQRKLDGLRRDLQKLLADHGGAP